MTLLKLGISWKGWSLILQTKIYEKLKKKPEEILETKQTKKDQKGNSTFKICLELKMLPVIDLRLIYLYFYFETCWFLLQIGRFVKETFMYKVYNHCWLFF